MAEATESSCRTRCWLGAAVLGVVAGLLLHRVAGVALVPSVVIGALVLGVGGVLGPGVLCPARAPRDETAPAPVAAPAPAPAAAVAPRVAAEAGVVRAPRVSGPSGPASGPSGAHDAARPVSGLDAALARAQRPREAAAPEFLSAPRGGKADDLKLIRGIGPRLERLLNEVGVWHFDQIAAWRARDIALVDEKMTGFHGRITRDEWVRQAREIVEARKGKG